MLSLQFQGSQGKGKGQGCCEEGTEGNRLQLCFL